MILSKFIIRLINWKIFCTKTAVWITWLARIFRQNIGTKSYSKFSVSKGLGNSPTIFTIWSIQIRTRTNCILKKKLPSYNIRFPFQTKGKIQYFFYFKDRIPSFLCRGIDSHFSVVGLKLSIAKLSVILKSECVNTWKSWKLLGKEFRIQ